MRYLKTFENFAEQEEVSANRAPQDSVAPEGISEKTEKTIEDKIDAMSPDQLAKAQKELESLASKLKLSVEDLQDASKVEAALKANPLNISESSINEGFNEWWGRVKNKVSSWVTRIGAVGIIGSLISLGIGAEMAEHATTLADYSGATVNPSEHMIISGIAMVISTAAVIIGMKMSGSTDRKFSSKNTPIN